MKAQELKDKSEVELQEILTKSRQQGFQSKIANFTNQLDNTSSIPKQRKDVARILTELRRREIDAIRASVMQALGQEEGVDR